MKIYIDVLIVTNCIIELIYLHTASALAHKHPGKWRVCAASLFGGLLSLLICADGGSFSSALVITIGKAAGIIITMIIGIKLTGFIDFLRCLVIYILVRAAYTGLIIMYWELSDTNRIYVRNFTTYFDISLLRLAAAVITAYILLALYELMANRIRTRETRYVAVYRSGDYEVTLPAVADTGNRLCDSFTGLPVVIFCCDDMYEHYSLYDAELGARAGFRLTPYSTIDGGGLIAVTSRGKVTIKDEKGSGNDIRCCVGIKPSNKELSRAVFDPQLLE